MELKQITIGLDAETLRAAERIAERSRMRRGPALRLLVAIGAEIVRQAGGDVLSVMIKSPGRRPTA